MKEAPKKIGVLMMSLGALSVSSIIISIALLFYWIVSGDLFTYIIYAVLAAGSINSLTWITAEKMEKKYYGESQELKTP